jgi:DNA modification methylase
MSAAQAWPAASPETRELAKLRRFPENSRTHSEAQKEQICAAMLQFGWTFPLLIDENDTILAGNGRADSAEMLVGRGHIAFAQAPVIVARGWTEAQKRAYVIADNKLAENAGWDSALLASELQSISGAGFDMSVLGFSPAELKRAMLGPGGGLTNPDHAPDVQAEEITQLGECWILGGHRIRCGDSTAAADVAALLDGQEPGLMVTDPPYGVNYDPAWRAKVTGQKVRASGKVLNDDRADWREAWVLFPGAVAYVWHGALHAGEVQASLLAAGFEVRSQIIWEKDRFALSRGHFHWRHEPAWYAVRKGCSANWKGGRKRDTVWSIEGPGPVDLVAVQRVLTEVGGEEIVWRIPMTVDDGSTGHGTQKPVECMRRPMELNSEEGDLVYEPFSGSGSSIIAGEQSGRRVLAMELSPAYVDVAVRRWEAFTGQSAVLQGDGRTFAQVEASRKTAPPESDDDASAWS